MKYIYIVCERVVYYMCGNVCFVEMNEFCVCTQFILAQPPPKGNRIFNQFLCAGHRKYCYIIKLE